MIQALKAWGPAALWVAVLFFLSELQPDADSAWLSIPDKVAHLGLYLVLGATLAWGGRAAGISVAPWVLISLGIGYGLLDEWHQSLVPGRDPSLGDALADAAGVILGFALFRLLLRPRRRDSHASLTNASHDR